MNKEPTFFKDTGAMGDVLGEAQRLIDEAKKEAQALEEELKAQQESVDEYREQVEKTRYQQVIKELIGEGVEDVKGVVAGMVNEWKEKKLQMKQREDELTLQQQALLEREQKLESRIQEFETEQQERMRAEMQNLAQLSANVKAQMDELEKTKNTIDSILTEDDATIGDKVLTEEDVEFLRLNYYSLLQSRLANQGVINPLTGERYSTDAWKIRTTNEELTAKVTKGVIPKHNAVGFDVKFIVPEAEEGYIYQKSGKEVADTITDFIQTETRDTKSFEALVLVSPTGWSDWAIEKVETILNMTKSVYLVDLSERTIFFNEGDKKTKQIEEWFAPVPVEEEIAEMVTTLTKEIEEAGVPQFRADKVCEKYQVPRRIVIGAFKDMVDEGKGELIAPEEGAKDSILLVR
jgi:hypothetical protein